MFLRNKITLSRKRWYWLLGEAFLIFMSVIAAFWVDQMRESRTEREGYLHALLAFRNATHSQIEQFRRSYDSTIHHKPVLMGTLKDLNEAIAILTLPEENYPKALKHLMMRPISNWRTQVIKTEELNIYATHLLRDTLFYELRNYQGLMNIEYDYMESFNQRVESFRDFLMRKVEMRDQSKNRLTKEDWVYIKNITYDLKGLLDSQLMIDQTIANENSKMIMRIDKVLVRRGVEESSLNVKYLIKRK